MSLDATFADLAAQGWLVNNLYQIDATLWRVNLRRPAPSGDWFTDWAIGPTLEEALEECMSKLNDAEFTADLPIAHRAAPSVDFASTLGLAPKPLIITRR